MIGLDLERSVIRNNVSKIVSPIVIVCSRDGKIESIVHASVEQF